LFIDGNILHCSSGMFWSIDFTLWRKDALCEIFHESIVLCSGRCRRNAQNFSYYSECSIIWHPPSQLIICRITNCQIIESNYVAKYSTSPINYPLRPVGLWNVGLSGVGLSSIHWVSISWLDLIIIWLPWMIHRNHLPHQCYLDKEIRVNVKMWPIVVYKLTADQLWFTLFVCFFL